VIKRGNAVDDASAKRLSEARKRKATRIESRKKERKREKERQRRKKEKRRSPPLPPPYLPLSLSPSLCFTPTERAFISRIVAFFSENRFYRFHRRIFEGR